MQAPGDIQSYNRYAYVRNNPLAYTDPSGFSWLSKHWRRVTREVRRWESDFRHEIRRPNSLLGPVLQAGVYIGSAFCGPAAPACAAAGTAAVGRAQGITGSDLARAAGVSGAAQWAFGPTTPPTTGQAAMRIGINVAAAHDPRVGQALMYISGSWGVKSFGGWATNAVGSYAQYEISQELARFAGRNGMTLMELNLLLAANSQLGLKVAGTTYRESEHLVTGFFTRRDGVFGNKWDAVIGGIWDVNDSLLNAQGLLDAVSLSVVSKGYTGHLTGHSLGAWRVNNLLRQGFISGATTFALPAFAYPAAGSASACISSDPICGGNLFTALRVGTVHMHRPPDVLTSHDLQQYQLQWR